MRSRSPASGFVAGAMHAVGVSVCFCAWCQKLCAHILMSWHVCMQYAWYPCIVPHELVRQYEYELVHVAYVDREHFDRGLQCMSWYVRMQYALLCMMSLSFFTWIGTALIDLYVAQTDKEHFHTGLQYMCVWWANSLCVCVCVYLCVRVMFAGTEFSNHSMGNEWVWEYRPVYC
jgi:hypothetical protein